MNFYDVLAAEKWGGGIPTINFFDLLFAQYMGGGEQWQTYEGTLPATLNANGDDMKQYQIYGADGGVGDGTVNLFSSVWEQGSINATTGQNEESSERVRTEGYIEVIPNKIYSFSRSIYNAFMNVRFYSSDKSFIGIGSTSTIRLIVGGSESNPMPAGYSFCCFEIIDTNIKYMRISDQSNNLATKYMMVEGEYTQRTMPDYEPYGYKLDMATSDGTNVTTTSIYIGDDPLDKDEYIDYQAGKIYRYETEMKKDVSQTGWQWRWETDDVTYQATLSNRVSVGRFYPEDTKEYIISAVPNTFEVAVILADSSDIKTADTGWGASWTLSGASAHSFCVTVRKSDNSDITPSEVDGVKFKVTASLTPTDPPVPLPALPTCDGTTVIDYVGQSVAPEKVLLEYVKGGN